MNTTHPFTNRESEERTSSESPKLVVIEGAIGAGKTTLTRMLCDRWKARGIFETFEDNPFLTGGFYDNTDDEAFSTEVFFLLTRYRQQRKLMETLEKSSTIVSDYFFDKNKIFAQMNLDKKDFEIYKDLYGKLEQEAPKPDLVVFLQADLESLLRRIYFRDRKFERSLSPAYLEKLLNAYYHYFTSYTKSPVLTIDISGMDFVSDPKDFESVLSKIESRLDGQTQLKLRTSPHIQEVRAHA